MAANRQFEQLDTLTGYLAATLNSLAVDTSDLGATIDNSGANPDMFMDLELYLASFDISGQTNSSIDIYFIYALDGTNYTDGADGVSTDALHPPAQNLAVSIAVRQGSGAETKRAVVMGIMIPRCKFKMYVVNETGVQLAAANNTLKYDMYKEQVVAA